MSNLQSIDSLEQNSNRMLAHTLLEAFSLQPPQSLFGKVSPQMKKDSVRRQIGLGSKSPDHKPKKPSKKVQEHKIGALDCPEVWLWAMGLPFDFACATSRRKKKTRKMR
jgi:hypothetical protein